MESDKEFTFRCSGLMSDSFGVFKEMKCKGELCDITIQYGNRSISAHRIVLAACIPYFRETFANRRTAANQNEITVGNLDSSALESLIEFSYTCEVDITTENVNALLSVSCFLRIDPVHEACCDFISKQMNPKNVFIIRNFAESVNCSSLLERVNRYVCKNFDEVSESEIFLEAPFSCVKELMSRDDLQASKEEKVFEFAMRWVKKQPDERQSYLPELLSAVRMALLTPEYLTDCLRQDLIRSSISCRDILEDARTFHFLPQRRSLISSFEITPRSHIRNRLRRNEGLVPGVYAVCSSVEEDSTLHTAYSTLHTANNTRSAHSLQYFDAERKEWSVVDELPFIPRSFGGAALVEANGILYFYDSDCIRSYDPPTGNWIQNYFFDGKFNAGIAVLHKKLYICGGTDDDAPVNTVTCFDLENNVFLKVRDMPLYTFNLGAVALDDLYVIGGRDQSTKHYTYCSVCKYNVDSKVWSRVSSMPSGRFAMGCATLGGKLYVCGGKMQTSVISSAEVYDPLKNQWSYISSMNTPRYGLSLVSYDRKLYAIGGKDINRKPVSIVEIYRPETDLWELGTSLDRNVTFAKAASINLPGT